MRQTACYVSSTLSSADEDDDAGVIDAVKQIVGERVKLKAKVQV